MLDEIYLSCDIMSHSNVFRTSNKFDVLPCLRFSYRHQPSRNHEQLGHLLQKAAKQCTNHHIAYFSHIFVTIHTFTDACKKTRFICTNCRFGSGWLILTQHSEKRLHFFATHKNTGSLSFFDRRQHDFGSGIRVAATSLLWIASVESDAIPRWFCLDCHLFLLVLFIITSLVVQTIKLWLCCVWLVGGVGAREGWRDNHELLLFTVDTLNASRAWAITECERHVLHNHTAEATGHGPHCCKCCQSKRRRRKKCVNDGRKMVNGKGWSRPLNVSAKSHRNIYNPWQTPRPCSPSN